MNTSATTSATAKQRTWLLVLWQAAIFLAACAILVTRRPDAIFHAQFYAEDGQVWFANAYNQGWWNALLHAQAGYFTTFPRLGAALALLAPLTQAPRVMNLVAIAAQALPVNLLLSSRSSAWGSVRFRTLMAATYLALPDCREISLGITLSQWVLALCAYLLLVDAAPRSRTTRLFDLFIFLLSGLTGPFCIFLLPIAVFLAWKRRSLWRWVPAGVLAACSLLQAYALLTMNSATRTRSTLGASPAMFTRILGGHVVLGAVLGPTRLPAVPGRGIFILLACAAVTGAVIAAICFLKSAVEMKLFLLLSAMLLAASLVSPTTMPPAGVSVWESLAAAGGARYWFFSSLALAWTLLWGAWRGNAVLKPASIVFLCAMCLGAALNWRQPVLNDLHFAEDAMRFEAAPPGTVMMFPENPAGWTMRLVKHASD